MEVMEKLYDYTLVKRDLVFLKDGAEILIHQTHHGYELVEVGDAKIRVRPDGSCHDNRFPYLDEAVSAGIQLLGTVWE